MDTNEMTDRAGVLHSESTEVPMNPTFSCQLNALVVRNILIKTRARRTLLVEMATPCIYLLILVALVVYFEMNALPIPPPHPGIIRSFRALDGFLDVQNNTLAVAPQTEEVKAFMEHVSKLWTDMQPESGTKVHIPIQYQIFETADDLADNYWRDPQSFQIGIVFLNPYPISQKLEYELRGNPEYGITPPTTQLFSASDSCLGQGPIKRQWNGIFPDTGKICPVQQYYLSGFIGVQALLDFAKIRIDSKQDDVVVPDVVLELLPRDRELKSNVLEGVTTLEDLFKLLVVPTFIMLVMSQYTTYLIVLIVGEKESHVRTAMKMMGVRDSAYWMSWFLCYTILIAKLALIVLIVLYFSDFFPNSSYTLLFTAITLYGCSTINISFILSTFFHNARTAGLLASFMTTLLSAAVLIDASLDIPDTAVQYVLAIISPLAFGKFLYLSMALEVEGSGMTWTNMWYSSPGTPCPGGYLLMLIVDICFYGLLAYYLDNVLPNEHNIRRSPLFFLHPNFWIRKRKRKATTMANGEPFTYINADESAEADIEPVPLELKGREAIRIEDLHKTFGSFCKPRAKAVNGINLTIYEGQITAILGHNGAGKTTLFNVLLGVTAPTSGTAYIYGYDVRDPNDLEQIRRMTGVCPQFDILFKTLTPREHLRFYGTIRGIPSSKLDSEIIRMLTELDLLEKADCASSSLSGGQRRKLSVGNALIGDPKIIVLDEPSAGVDPHSRRHMWSILQNRKAGKVTLLTTHFMDEADILAERKAVISKGRLRCCGSSLFLKNKFGIGYHLTLVLSSDANESSIASLVMRYVHKAERARRHGRELSFILPHNGVNSFPDLFAAIEHEITKRRGLGITSYGVAMTTLEEVFLHLERDETEEVDHDTVMENLSKSMLRNRAMSRSLSIPSKSTSYHSLQNEGAAGMAAAVESEISQNNARQKKFIEKTISEPVPLSSAGNRKQVGNGGILTDLPSPSPAQEPPFFGPIEVRPRAYQQLKAMMHLRIICLLRDIYKLFNLVVIPLLISTYLVYNSASHNRPPEMPALTLDGRTYHPHMRIALLANDSPKVETHELIRGLKSVGAVGVYTYGNDITQLMSEAPYIAALSMEHENSSQSLPLKVKARYNDTAQHSLPIVMNLISNAVYKMVMANVSRSSREALNSPELMDDKPDLVVKSHPLDRQIDGSADLSYAFTAGSIGATFLTVAATIGVDMVYDREIRAKNQLRVNGLPFTIYFFTFFLVMLAVLLFIFLFLVFVAWLCSVAWLTSGPAVAMFGLLLLAFCPVAIVAATTLSYCFQKTESAASILPGLMLIPGLAPYIAIVFVRAQRTKEILHIIGSFIDPLYLPIGATNQMINQYILCMESARCRREGISMSDYATRDIGVIFGGCGVAFVIWSFILFVVDLRSSGRSLQDLFRKNRATVSDGGENVDYGDHGDDDVKAERQKVSRIMSEHHQSEKSPVVVVQKLRKIYDKDDSISKCCACCGSQDVQQKLALRELSLAIDSGEVFGLLGHNGAGKTTTMKIIIAEEAPTRGRVQIAGYDVMSHMNQAFSKMGYCPQHDAQWKKVTVKEHLNLYAAIRGVPPSAIPRLVDSYITGLQIKEHAGKRASACSGGTRRKLSFAMAMVGNPAVVLMDEPSCGMDPRSKRFLWDTILASFQGTRGAILTTHAMEEADALCSRVGIMVKGELRCIGPTQHLKNLYGAGYTLEMKLIDLSATTTVADRLANVLAYINTLFQDARLVESFSDRMVFEVPQKNVSSVATCFKNLEKAKEELNIAEYSFSQTTLEQVFLKFSHDNEEDD